MPEDNKTDWLLLNEATDLFSRSYIPEQLFDEILKSGRVRLYGKPPFPASAWRADPIEHLLARVRKVRISALLNEITLCLYPESGDETGIAGQFSLVPGAPLLSLSEWFVKFTGVRVDRARLIEEAEAAGFRIVDPPGPQKRADYKPALEQFIDNLPPDTNMSNDAIAGQFIAHIETLKNSGESVPRRLPQRRNIEVQVEKLRKRIRCRRRAPTNSN
jgi:hypothetical protein